jgi:hypothetical protein
LQAAFGSWGIRKNENVQLLFLFPEGDFCCLGSSKRNPATPEAARPNERERVSPRQDEGKTTLKGLQPWRKIILMQPIQG